MVHFKETHPRHDLRGHIHAETERVSLQDNNFSGFCEALAVGSLQDASISVTLAQPEDAQRCSTKQVSSKLVG